MVETSKRGTASRSDGNREDPMDHEVKLSEFEYAIWHLGAAFARWRRDCLGSVADVPLSNTEASVWHVIHMNGTPKGVMEIARLLHRDDLANIQYGLKKLGQLGLIEKRGNSRKNMTYAVSEEGNRIVDAYLEQRRAILLRLFERAAPSPDDLTDMILQMHVMIGLYDQAGGMIMNRQP